MERESIRAMAAFLILGLHFFSACEFDSPDESSALVIGDVNIIFDDKGGAAKEEVFYPGVDAYRVNYMLNLEDISVSSDLTEVSFTVFSQADRDLEKVWLKLVVSGAELVTKHPLINAAGENILVLGPLQVFGRIPVTLTFNVLDSQGYTISLDFLEVRERIAFQTNRASPQYLSATEIFTINPDGSNLYQVTRDSPDFTGTPTWSPGGEWIAFDRVMPANCGSTIYSRTQIYRVHPDGSNLTHISKGMFHAAEPYFNPTGDLIAYQCIEDCKILGKNICVYDNKTRTQRVMFSGSGYYNNIIKLPRWSPDGKFMIMEAKTRDVEPITPYPDDMCYASDSGPSWVKLWLYAPMDPLSGESLEPPAPLVKSRYYEYPQGSGNFYKITIRDLVWAPDSRHMVMYHKLSELKLGKKGCYFWAKVSKGFAITDFEAIVEDQTLSVYGIPHQNITQAVDIVEGRGKNPPKLAFPKFNQNGTRLWFDLYHSGDNTDLMYVELEGYQPLTDPDTGDIVEVTFLADGLYNRMPAPFSPIISSYFPLLP